MVLIVSRLNVNSYYQLLYYIQMSNIYIDITNLYTKGGFMSRYAGDLYIAVIICLIVFLVMAYYWVNNNIQPILNDWSNQKCNPAVIPFAGMINAPSGTSSLDFTSQNFEQCIQNILGDITEYAFTPIYYVMTATTSVFQELSDAVNAIRAVFDTVRNSISEQGNDLNSRILNIMLPLTGMMNKMGAIFGKVQGTLISGIYTLYGGFITTESLFLFIYEVVVELLWVILAFILVCFAVGWLFPPTLAAGMAASAFLSILLIPLVVFVIIMSSMSDVFASAGLNTPPSVPQYVCFSGDTKITTQTRGDVKMSELYLGEKLYDGSFVTAFIKSSASSCDMYNIDGILVTGSHLIFEPTRGWVHSCEHSKSIKVPDFKDDYVYCIGTNNKLIHIGGHVFMDWDEINDDEVTELKNNPELRINLPSDFSKYDIHRYIESGLHPNTTMYLQDGTCKCLKDLNVKDVLLYGETVNSIIKIQSDDMEFYNLMQGDNIILSVAKNTEVIIDSLDTIVWKKIESPTVCYHIVTDKGGFKLPGLFIGSYNRGIDRYLEEDKSRGGLYEYLFLS